ncbi:response regulator [Granulosicoccaceae sp. 1_MG-2023]|nr:response regulator [Granulosicoccaceae sp. 1_MG-2023]
MSVRRSILVVDDQMHITRIIKRSLSAQGYDVELAQNGEQALGLLQSRGFDVLLTDYQMPRMNGKDLCETIRADMPDKVGFMILSTAVADESLRSWAENLGEAIYLEKPVSMRRLLVLIDEYFSRAADVGELAG